MSTDNTTDFIRILQEIRGTGAQGEAYTDGMWWEMTIKVIDYMNGNGAHAGGIYTHIKYMYENMKTDLGSFYDNYGEFLVKYADFLIKYEEMLTLGEDIEQALIDANTIGAEATGEFWKTMAERMTASSYAVEPVGEFVKIWTSVGDGTFYNEPTTSYSALHWALKADETVNGTAYYKLDGTAPLEANMDANTFKIMNLADAFNEGDAVPLSQMTSAIGEIVQQDVFLKPEHLAAATGGADSGLPIVLNGNGKVDASFIDFSSNNAIGSHDPSSAGGGVNEYPLADWCMTGADNIEANWGSYWFVTELIAEDGGVPDAGYTFNDNSCVEGSLFGQTIYEGDIMIFTSSGWLIQKSTIDPDLYYRLDGSRAITASFDAGGNTLINVAPGVNDTDAVNVAQLDAAVALPIGTVMMFAGIFADLASYPQWSLCDGTNGTVDLRDTFIYGTATEDDLRVTGGYANATNVEHSHTGPSHTHTGASHRHDITHDHNAGMSDAGEHTHQTNAFMSEICSACSGDKVEVLQLNTDTSIVTDSDGRHDHIVDVYEKDADSGYAGTGNTGAAGTGSTSTVGESGTGRNIPPFIKLAYIQKISE